MPRHLHSGFQGGELDPLMSGRVDTENYKAGLSTCENFMAMATGPLIKRGGFVYIRDAAPTASWLSLFAFSISQEYLIEWSEKKARFYTNGGRIETSPILPYELVTPYTAGEAPALSLQQSFDRLYIDHALHPPAAITRTSAVTFTFADLTLVGGPFADSNADETITVSASDTGGLGITLTAAKPVWQPGHVGELFELAMKDFSNSRAWEPGMAGVTVNLVAHSDGKAYYALTAGTTGSVQPTHDAGDAWDGLMLNDVAGKGPYGVLWRFWSTDRGVVKITAVAADGLSATGDVVKNLPPTLSAVASWKWAHGAFSDAAGWPSLVTLWAGRMIHIKDFDVIGSVVGDYGGGRVNFETRASSGQITADMAFRRRLSTSDPPLWIASDLTLLLGTARKELSVGTINSQAAVAGDNLKATDQSFHGGQAVPPVQLSAQTIFVERGGRRLRSTAFDLQRDRNVAIDLTIASRQVTRSNIIQLVPLKNPWPMLIAVRGDGQLAVHADTLDNIKGFARFVLGGAAKVLSAAAVVGPDGLTDDLWLLVERERKDGLKREVWRQRGWRMMGDDPQESFYVDAGVRIAAVAGQTVFTGLTHLAGQDVAVLAAGGVVPGMAVDAAGKLTLPVSSVPAGKPFVVNVGLAFTALAVTMPPEVSMGLGGGTSQGLLKRVRKAVVRLLETLGVKVGGADSGDPLEEVTDRAARDYMDAPIPLFTGDTQGLIETEYDRSGAVRFVSDVPLPAIITAAMLTMEVDKDDA